MSFAVIHRTGFSVPRNLKGEPPMTLEELRDDLREAMDLAQPEEVPFNTGSMSIQVEGPDVTLRRVLPGGVVSEPYCLTRHAAQQILRPILPERGWSTFEVLMNGGSDMTDNKVGSMLVANFVRKPATHRDAVLRVVNQGGKRIARAAVGHDDWLDDLDLVEATLAAVGNAAVVEAQRWGEGFFARLITDMTQAEAFRGQFIPGTHHFPKDPGVPLPVVTIQNGEVGNRSVRIDGGLFRVVCTNGLVDYQSQGAEARWSHNMGAEVLAPRITARLQHEVAKSDGTLAAYNAALNIGIDDMLGFMMAELTGSTAGSNALPQAFVTEAHTRLLTDQSLFDEDLVHDGSTLAAAVDLVTLQAQNLEGWERVLAEAAAARMMRRGLNQAAMSGGRILVEA